MRLALLVTATLLPVTPARAAPNDLAAGALSYLVARVCDPGYGDSSAGIEWPTYLQPRRAGYSRGGPGSVQPPAPAPSWGPKRVARCSLPPYEAWAALAAGALWSTADHAAIEADPQGTLFNEAQTRPAFQQVFGFDRPQWREGATDTRYTIKQLQGLYDKLYRKPGAKLGELSAQAVYNVVLAGTVTRFAREVAFIHARLSKPQLAKLAKDYAAAAQAKEKEGGVAFYGPSWLQQQARALLAPDSVLTGVHSGRTLGTMLRRMDDGTWPTVLTLLKKVLKDYDPALLKELGAML